MGAPKVGALMPAWGSSHAGMGAPKVGALMPAWGSSHAGMGAPKVGAPMPAWGCLLLKWGLPSIQAWELPLKTVKKNSVPSQSLCGTVPRTKMSVSDIWKYFRPDTYIKKYKHHTNVPAISPQLLYGEDSISWSMRWWIKLIVMAQLARMFPLVYLLPQHSYYMVRIVCPARRCQAESSIEPSFKQKKARLEGVWCSDDSISWVDIAHEHLWVSQWTPKG